MGVMAIVTLSAIKCTGSAQAWPCPYGSTQCVANYNFINSLAPGSTGHHPMISNGNSYIYSRLLPRASLQLFVSRSNQHKGVTENSRWWKTTISKAFLNGNVTFMNN